MFVPTFWTSQTFGKGSFQPDECPKMSSHNITNAPQISSVLLPVQFRLGEVLIHKRVNKWCQDSGDQTGGTISCCIHLQYNNNNSSSSCRAGNTYLVANRLSKMIMINFKDIQTSLRVLETLCKYVRGPETIRKILPWSCWCVIRASLHSRHSETWRGGTIWSEVKGEERLLTEAVLDKYEIRGDVTVTHRY